MLFVNFIIFYLIAATLDLFKYNYCLLISNDSRFSIDNLAVFKGDLYVGVLLPLHKLDENGACSDQINIDGILSLESTMFTLELIRQQNILQGFDLGALVLDTCMSEKYAMLQAFSFILRSETINFKKLPLPLLNTMSRDEENWLQKNLVGIIGPWSSATTIQVANMLGEFKIPQIGFAATSPELDNESKFPYFLRTVPSDKHQARVIIELLRRFRWTHVIAIFEDSNYGRRGFAELEKLASVYEICFAMQERLHDDWSESEYKQIIRKMVDQGKVTVVILYMTTRFANKIFQAADNLGYQDKFLWIGSDGWGSRFIDAKHYKVADGAITTHPAYAVLRGFEQHFYSLRFGDSLDRNPWFDKFWRQQTKCETDELCKQKSLKNLLPTTEFGYVHFTAEAILAFAYALKQLHFDFCGFLLESDSVCPAMANKLYDSKTLLHYLKTVSFNEIIDKKFTFYNGREGAPVYSLLQFRAHKGIGVWDLIGEVSLTNSEIILNLTNSEEGLKEEEGKIRYRPSECGFVCGLNEIRRYKQDKCCWLCEKCQFLYYKTNETTCSQCPVAMMPNRYANFCEPVEITYVHFDNMFIVGVTVFNCVGICLATVFLILFIYNSSTPIIKASGRELSAMLLIGIYIGYVVVFLILLRPEAIICAVVRFLYGLSFCVCYAAIFTKTNRISRIFERKLIAQKRARLISPLSQVIIVLSLIGFQCIINVVWLFLRPPFINIRPDINYELKSIRVYAFCEAFQDADMMVGLILPVILLILSALYAFKTRKCPGAFNEAKYIALTTYTTCVVWLAFIPGFFATYKIPLRVFALCAAVSLNSSVTLVCMFIPKLYIVICRPHKNTKDQVLGKLPRSRTTTTASTTATKQLHPHHHRYSLSNEYSSGDAWPMLPLQSNPCSSASTVVVEQPYFIVSNVEEEEPLDGVADGIINSRNGDVGL